MIDSLMSLLIAITWGFAAAQITSTYDIPITVTFPLAVCGSFATTMLAKISESLQEG